MTDNNEIPRRGDQALKLVGNNQDEVDQEAIELLKTFCLDPLSAKTGDLIDKFVAKRCRRATLRIIK